MHTHRNVLLIIMSITVFLSAYSNTEFMGELVISITDNSQHQIDVTAISTIWGSQSTNFTITQSYNSYTRTFSSAAFDFCESQDNGLPVIGYGLYKITIDGTYYIYVDERDCDWTNQDLYADPDITFNYNPSSHTWTAVSSGYQGSVTQGNTFNLWTLKTSPQTPNTSKFQPTDPSGLVITNVGNHPSLTWNASSAPGSAKYHVYRSGSQITTSALTNASYIDYSIELGSQWHSTYVYKVRAVSGDGSTSWSANYTNQVSVTGTDLDKMHGPEPILIASSPTQFDMSQNYPNPFNPTTSINYQIPTDGLVSLKVYDALGQVVRTVVSEYQVSGTYTVTFDASNVTSGIYFYSMTSSGYKTVKKMLLLK